MTFFNFFLIYCQVILGLKTRSTGFLTITGVQFSLLIPSIMSDDTVKRVIKGWQRFEMLSPIQFNVLPQTSLLKVDYKKTLLSLLMTSVWNLFA